MDYFNRDSPKSLNLKKSIDTISRELDSFYENKSNSKNEFIRLHSSTLGKDEFIALSKAFLEGNITMGVYNSNYENLAKNIF